MRQRDYKAEYAARKAKAKRKGYSGYNEQRKARSRAKAWQTLLAKNIAENLQEFFEQDDILDDRSFWQALREFYNQPII